MKRKTILIVVISACLIAGLSTLALGTAISLNNGATTTLQSPQSTSTGISITPSSKVSLYIVTDAGTLGTGTSYAIGSCHEQGDKVFGEASGSSNVYFIGIDQGTCADAAFVAGKVSTYNSSAFSTWSSI
jgi:hypothetical protein